MVQVFQTRTKNNCSANPLQVQHKKKTHKCFQTAQVHQFYLDIIWQNSLECIFYCTTLLKYSWIRVLISVNWHAKQARDKYGLDFCNAADEQDPVFLHIGGCVTVWLQYLLFLKEKNIHILQS